MTDAPLSELERSRLAGEFKSLPRDERRRISRAGNRGVVLPTEAERNYQRVLVRQLPRWALILACVMMPLQALNTWWRYGSDHSLFQLAGGIMTTAAALGAWWMWWGNGRLRRRLSPFEAPADASPEATGSRHW